MPYTERNVTQYTASRQSEHSTEFIKDERRIKLLPKDVKSVNSLHNLLHVGN